MFGGLASGERHRDLFGKVAQPGWTYTTQASYSVSGADYDRNGFVEVFEANYALAPPSPADFLYRNNGNETFTRTLEAEVGAVAAEKNCTRAGCWGDFNNDGFVDLSASDTVGRNTLLRNLGNGNHWLKFQLEGTVANREAIGARIRVKATIAAKTFWQMCEIASGGLYLNEPRQNFCLGDAARAEEIRIEWPSGAGQEFKDVAASQILTIAEPARLAMEKLGEPQIQCRKGQAFQVQLSTDLKSWTTAATVTNQTGASSYVDPEAGKVQTRYYRVSRANGSAEDLLAVAKISLEWNAANRGSSVAAFATNSETRQRAPACRRTPFWDCQARPL